MTRTLWNVVRIAVAATAVAVVTTTAGSPSAASLDPIEDSLAGVTDSLQGPGIMGHSLACDTGQGSSPSTARADCEIVGGGVVGTARFRVVFTCQGDGADKHYYGSWKSLSGRGDRGVSLGSCPRIQQPVTNTWVESSTSHSG